MTESEKVSQLCEGFTQLSEEGQDYMLAVLQALSFAKNTLLKPPPKPDNAPKTA